MRQAIRLHIYTCLKKWFIQEYMFRGSFMYLYMTIHFDLQKRIMLWYKKEKRKTNNDRTLVRRARWASRHRICSLLAGDLLADAMAAGGDGDGPRATLDARLQGRSAERRGVWIAAKATRILIYFIFHQRFGVRGWHERRRRTDISESARRQSPAPVTTLRRPRPIRDAAAIYSVHGNRHARARRRKPTTAPAACHLGDNAAGARELGRPPAS